MDPGLSILSNNYLNTGRMKKVVVTGASGFVGGLLCRTLLKQGHSVRALVRRTSDLSGLPSPSTGETFELAYGDVTDYWSLLDAFFGCDVIFHAAAVVEPWLPDPSKFFSVNVGGLKNVVQAAKETKTIEKVIYTSSMVALGSTDGYVADESQVSNAIWFRIISPRSIDLKDSDRLWLLQVHHEKYFYTEYERSKVAADKVASQAAAEGLPIVTLYPGLVYGPGKLTTGNALAKMLIARFTGLLPGYMGCGNDRLSFCHVDDVVGGHIAAMDKGRSGERYLLTGENASISHVLDLAAIITRTEKPRFSIPLWVIEACGWLSILISHFTGKLPLVSPPSVHVLRHQWEYSCEKARIELDYNPRSLKEGLGELLLWLKSSGAITY
ncbi:hypothetical protein DKX38_002724 [Salix brachista]|uniref:NAD-dependent epimerase/dehydratase domain-containing protein n=1 Tax=Salix brachista TaxID=2182728 RepID=A0A5N5NQU1_9ROSI|nr:hypothetical protein DKX38_002724 [Salix brachista]